jgi:hypothetical protein
MKGPVNQIMENIPVRSKGTNGREYAEKIIKWTHGKVFLSYRLYTHTANYAPFNTNF